MNSTKTKPAPSIKKLEDALELFVGRKLHELTSEGEARQLLCCLVEEKASPRGKRNAIYRVRQLVADAKIVDGRGNGHRNAEAVMTSAEKRAKADAKRAAKRAQDKATRASMKGK